MPLQPVQYREYTDSMLAVLVLYLCTARPDERVSSRLNRSWVTATGVTLVVDVMLRKPMSVVARAAIQTVRDVVRQPEDVYIGKGRNRKPLSRM